MREALAAADHDFVLAEPAAKSKRFRDRTSGAKRRGASRTGRRNRLLIGGLAGALCVATIAGILVNALVLQKTRHPAPLFARAAPIPGMKEPSIAETVRHAPPRPANAPAAKQGNDRPVEHAPAEPPPPEKLSGDRARQTLSPAPAGEAVEARQHDPISELLKAPVHGAPSAAAPGPSKSVLAAQRALVKLGFVLKPDGVAGATTRQAIERYEREHKLPVRGALTPALLRRLSAESGVPIN